MDLDQTADATLGFCSYLESWRFKNKAISSKAWSVKRWDKAALAALCFSANKMNIPIQPEITDMLKNNEVAFIY